jgi:hypothetical protein
MIVNERDCDTIQKACLNGQTMRSRPASIIVILILLSSSSNIHAESKGVISNCINSDIDNLPESWTLEDQSCIRIDLGELNQNTVMSFNILTSDEIDIILFPANSLQVYLNEQSYRSDAIWQSESTFESFNGDGEWHWTVPGDREKTRWYMIIDNFAHPGDDGLGSQGGQESEVTFDAQEIISEPFTLSDSVIKLGTNSQSIAHGPFVVDAGSYVEIFARTMEGNPDIFIMTETQKDLYTSGGTAASRILEADMLQVSTERYQPWLVPEEYEGVNLYVMIDNRAGPGGGGAGTTITGITLTITINPILNPVISTLDGREIYNVGEIISFSALETPNRSNQIQESGFSWDVNGDDIDDYFGPYLDYSWDNPDNISLKLSIISTEGIISSKIFALEVTDNSPPNASISANGDIKKGYNQTILLSSTFSDNWGIDRIDWLVDGNVEKSNYSISKFTSSFSFIFDPSYTSGEHIIEFIVTDKSGQSSSDTVKVILSDITPPVFRNYQNSISQNVGIPINFQIIADDFESSEIQYTWIFNQGTENKIQFSGMSVTYDFKSLGAQRVVCIAENEAGLSSEAEIIVNILELEIEDDSLDTTFIILIIILFLLIAIFVSFKLIQRKVKIRVEELSNQEEETIEENLPPTAEEQKQMWGENSIMSNNQLPIEDIQSLIPDIQSLIPEIDIEDLLADVQKGDLQSTNNFDSSLLNDLLDKKEPNISEAVIKEESINRLIKKNCSSCDLLFSVQLPENIDIARTACPKCGSIEDVSIL